MYIPPIIAPFSNPFFFILRLPIVLPIKMLIPVITMVTGSMVFSCILVYVNTAEKIINKISVVTNEIITPLVI